VFTTTAETVTAVTTAVAKLPAAAQEMFVGTPSF